MTRSLCGPVGALVLLFAACASEPPAAGDGEHDTFTTVGGGADAFGIEEGSCEGEAALDVASSASEHTLTVTIGLRSIAARNLIAARELAPLETLAELDAVPWIGPVSFQLILDYGRAQGFVADCERRRTGAGAAFGVTIEVRADGEGFDPDYGDWTYDDVEGNYRHSFAADVSNLPFRHSNGDFTATISAAGEVRLEYVYGDYDGSAGAQAGLPLDAPSGTRYTVGVDGGEHAGGGWNVDATMEITLP